MGGIEGADEFIQSQGGFPDFEQESAARAGAADGAGPIDGGIVAFVTGAASVEFASSNLQRYLSLH